MIDADTSFEEKLMETAESVVPPLKKQIPTPKAIIHQKFGSKASFTIEEVQENFQNECPGLAIPPKGPCLFRCRLELPGLAVVSATCNRKRDAEQSASEKALNELGISPEAISSPLLDAADELVSRLSYLLSSKTLPSVHPLCSHLKASLRREGDLAGFIPVSVMINCDPKINNLCKSIDPMAESNPFLAVPHIAKTASKLPDMVAVSEDRLCLRRTNSDASELTPSSVDQQLPLSDGKSVLAVHIPYSLDKDVQSLSLDVYSKGYYLDIIATELGLADANKILISRPIGKASSEMRLYFSALETCNLVSVPDSSFPKEALQRNGSFNARASYLAGQVVYGNAILASVGYRRKSTDIFYEDVSLRSYFRMHIDKSPSGMYKLSREVVLVAELPSVFTSKAQWRGCLPRELLSTFCRQHRLSEPVLNVIFDPVVPAQESACSCENSDTGDLTVDSRNPTVSSVTVNGNESTVVEGTYRCEVRLMSKSQELVLEYCLKDSYKKQFDAIQNAALRVLSWLSVYFKQQDTPLEDISSSGVEHRIQCNHSNISSKFALCWLMHSIQQRSGSQDSNSSCCHQLNRPNSKLSHQTDQLHIEGSESGTYPSNGSLVCIRYVVSLVNDPGSRKEAIENADEFEFENGTGAVIPCVEDAVMQITAAQSASFYTELPPYELILAAAADSSELLSVLSTGCCLEYSITLLRVTSPLEDRMEQAFFSPPLSKQRVEYALHHIRDSNAMSLIDFGCGSGSLLESLIGYPTSLEKIVGVDLSQKGLTCAAKVFFLTESPLFMCPSSLLFEIVVDYGTFLPLQMLHSKLSNSTSGVKKALLYEGSITVFDSYLCGFDMGTCLEVIEHMEEEDANLFGDIALSSFCPKILIVSTPNYEYNAILQKSSLSGGNEDDPEEEGVTQSQSCRFRNHDHKFEWTRAQFRRWATGLAMKHKYIVEFGGVGGLGHKEPGFASQIAVFRKCSLQEPETSVEKVDVTPHHCKLVWEWNAADQASADSVRCAC
ncbi:Small RNA 2'-O-methyltransferase-like protein [Drosera capensis]